VDVEHIGHRPLEGGIQVDVRRTENVLDRAQRVDLAVAGINDGALLNVRPDDIRGGSMRIDVVRSVLTVIFRDDNHGIGRIRTVRDSLNQPADREIIIGLLRFRRVHARKRRAETSGVVVAEAN